MKKKVEITPNPIKYRQPLFTNGTHFLQTCRLLVLAYAFVLISMKVATFSVLFTASSHMARWMSCT